MPVGRPTDYNDSIIPKTKEYLESCVDDLKEKIVKLPTMEGLAVFLKVNRTTLYEWESKHEEFSNIVSELKSKQAERLLNNGLAGTYNSVIAKLILSGKHGYVEKSETDITSKGESVNLDAKTLALAKEYENKLKQNL